jgi:predicted lipid-binding transport protein (Tim44 family)
VVTSNANQAPTEYALSYTSTPQPTSQTPSVTSALSSTTTQPQNPSNIVGSGNGGLSAGVITGAAIGSLVGVIALVGLGLMVWRNRRKMNKLESEMQGRGNVFDKPQGVESALVHRDTKHIPDSSPHTGTTEMPSDTAATEILSDTAGAEMPSNKGVTELPSFEAPQELRA